MLNGTVPTWPLRSRASQESLKKKTLSSRDRRCVAAVDCCLVSREVKKASKATSWGSQGQAGNCVLCMARSSSCWSHFSTWKLGSCGHLGDTSQTAVSTKESEREAIKSFPFTLHGYLMCFIPYTSSMACPWAAGSYRKAQGDGYCQAPWFVRVTM